MSNYKEKALYHIKNKLNKKYIVREVEGKSHTLELIFFEDPIAIFTNWENCYKYLKLFTKTTKRKWVEDKIDCRLVVWDTDLETVEQDCVTYLLEFFNYEQGSFGLEELREILAENSDEENTINACDILIKAMIKNGKETIEIE